MDNDALVDLVKNDDFYLKFKSPRDERVLEAMRKVDRRDFLPSDYNKAPFIVYADLPLGIGYGQTCSAPSMVGFMCDILELEEGMRVLEIGSGSGYHAAVTSRIIGIEGKLFSIEYILELKELAERNLRGHFLEEFDKRIAVIHGDGSIGLKDEAPFDRIYLTAGVQLKSFNPHMLAEQIKPEGGILLFPQKSGDIIKQTYESHILVKEQSFGPVSFVPLKGENS